MDILTGTLVANAASSTVTGIALSAGAGPVSDWLGIPTPVSVVVGVGLLLFAFDVIRIARVPQRDKVLRVVAADMAWVLGAAVVFFGYPSSMSTQGLWALGVVTVAVAVFAVLQTLGLRHGSVAA